MLGQPVSMLIPQGRRVQADRRDPAGRDRHRRRADDHRDAAPAGRGGQVRRVLRRGRRRGAAGQPGHDRQHEPRVRLHRRDLPDRRRDRALPQADRPPGRPARAGRGLRQGAGPLARPGRASPSSPRPSSSTCPRSSRRSPGRSARRTASSSRRPSRRSATVLVDYAGTRTRPTRTTPPRRSTRRSTSRSRRPSRPATRPHPAASPRTRPPLRGVLRRRGRRRPGEHARDRHARRRRVLRARPRRRRDRLDHLVHQHVEPVGDARRRAAGQERRRPGPRGQAVGEDVDGARLQGRHRLLRAGRALAVPGEAGLPPGRLRLHHLHRQLRAAGRGDLAPRSTRATSPWSPCCRATGTSRAGSTRTSR